MHYPYSTTEIHRLDCSRIQESVDVQQYTIFYVADLANLTGVPRIHVHQDYLLPPSPNYMPNIHYNGYN